METDTEDSSWGTLSPETVRGLSNVYTQPTTQHTTAHTFTYTQTAHAYGTYTPSIHKCIHTCLRNVVYTHVHTYMQCHTNTDIHIRTVCTHVCPTYTQQDSYHLMARPF